jgi:O-antigen ligase
LKRSKINIVLLLIIVSLLTFTSDFFELYRPFITAFSFFILILLFLKEHGLTFKNFKKVPKEILFFLLILFITLVTSSVFSFYPIVSFFATIRTLAFLIIVYIFFSFLNDEENIFYYIYSLIAIIIIHGIRMSIDLYNLGIQDFFKKILLSNVLNLTSSLGYTGMTVFFIGIALITSMIFMNKFKSLAWRIVLPLLLFISIIIIILSNSRGGILAAIISILFVLWKLNKSLLLKIFIFITFTILTLLILFPTLAEVVNVYLRWETVSDREVYWTMGLEVIKDYPFFGLGADLFDKFFFNYAPSSTLSLFQSDIIQLGKPHPHNFFLYFTAENGILGLVTAILFFVTFFRIAFKTMKLTKNENDYYVLSVAITGIGLAIFVRSFIEVAGYLLYGYLTRDLPFWLLFAILIYIYEKFNRNLNDTKVFEQKLINEN